MSSESSVPLEVDNMLAARETSMILVIDSSNAVLFKTVCRELSNRNVREMLRAIGAGTCTSSEIAERTNLTIQNVLLHLNRLKSTGLIMTNGNLKQLRGRSPTKYTIHHSAILLVVTGILGFEQVNKFLFEIDAS